MDVIILPTESFSVTKLQDLFYNGKLKDHLDAIQYIFKYFHEIDNGTYYFYNHDKDEFELKTKKDFSDGVIDKLPDKKVYNMIKMNDIIFRVICKIGKPRVYKENGKYYINESGAFLHQQYKNYDEYDEMIKNNVDMVFDMMKTIACNNDDKMFKAYLLNYAQIARGMKTEVIPLRKTSQQGTGKSTETDLFMQYVFGYKVCLLCSNAEPLLTSFNKIFMGKIFVVFEELPVFNTNQWSSVSSKLKTLATETKTMYRDVYEKAIQADNITNFMINTNEDVKDSNGRRIIPLDISLSKKGDYKYFEKIRKNCFNNEVGEAIFSYLRTKISDEECDNFYAQRDFPETNAKLIAKAKLLNSSVKFIKENFILKKMGKSKEKSSRIKE